MSNYKNYFEEMIDRDMKNLYLFCDPNHWDTHCDMHPCQVGDICSKSSILEKCTVASYMKELI